MADSSPSHAAAASSTAPLPAPAAAPSPAPSSSNSSSAKKAKRKSAGGAAVSQLSPKDQALRDRLLQRCPLKRCPACDADFTMSFLHLNTVMFSCAKCLFPLARPEMDRYILSFFDEEPD